MALTVEYSKADFVSGAKVFVALPACVRKRELNLGVLAGFEYMSLGLKWEEDFGESCGLLSF